jgi:hypothetical protein
MISACKKRRKLSTGIFTNWFYADAFLRYKPFQHAPAISIIFTQPAAGNFHGLQPWYGWAGKILQKKLFNI